VLLATSVSTVIEVVVGVLLLALVLLFLGGLVATNRRQRSMQERLKAEIEAADAALAEARATDRGWERETIEAAARGAFAERHPDRPVDALQLVRVVDRPGTESDQAVFRVVTADGGEETLTLGRRDGAWVPV
jgi:nitrogen fixation protein FixH